jgi:hypothetical protein
VKSILSALLLKDTDTEDPHEGVIGFREKRWVTISHLLKQGVNDEVRMHIINTASEKADDGEYASSIIPYHQCSDSLEPVFDRLLARDMWSSVATLLEHGVSKEQHRRALLEAFQRVGDSGWMFYFFPYVKEEHVQDILPHLSKEMAKSLNEFLQKHTGQDNGNVLRETATSMPAATGSIQQHMDVGTGQHTQSSMNIAEECGYGRWSVVGKLLQRGVDRQPCDEVVKGAVEVADEQSIVSHILPYCHDDHVESATQILVSRKMWRAVWKLVQRQGETLEVRDTVLAMIVNADMELVMKLFHFCRVDQLPVDDILNKAVHHGLWNYTSEILRHAKSVSRVSQDALQQARNTLDRKCKEFLCHILPHLSSKQRDEEFVHYVEHNIIECRLTDGVRRALWQGVSQTKLMWAAKYVFKKTL